VVEKGELGRTVNVAGVHGGANVRVCGEAIEGLAALPGEEDSEALAIGGRGEYLAADGAMLQAECCLTGGKNFEEGIEIFYGDPGEDMNHACETPLTKWFGVEYAAEDSQVPLSFKDLLTKQMVSKLGEKKSVDSRTEIVDDDACAGGKSFKLTDRGWLEYIEDSKADKAEQGIFELSGEGDEGEPLTGYFVDDNDLRVFAATLAGDDGSRWDTDSGRDDGCDGGAYSESGGVYVTKCGS